MPNIDSQRVRLLSAWARDYFTSGLILDVGSAGAQDPFLLNAIRKDVSAKCELVGVDMNLMGLKRLNGYRNLSAVGGNLYKLPFSNQTFDGCLMAEVLEHLYDAIGALSEVARVIKTGGIALFSTPNPFAGARAWNYWYNHPCPWDKENLWRSVGNRVDEKREEGTAHIQFYDPLSLCNLLVDVGFTVAEVTTTNLSFPYNPFSPRKEPLLWFCWKYLTRTMLVRRDQIPSTRLGVYTLIRAVRS